MRDFTSELDIYGTAISILDCRRAGDNTFFEFLYRDVKFTFQFEIGVRIGGRLVAKMR
ncbi:hypothetical protein NTG1052_350008 [Candidatus Nitrotoga sp. 1052]|nr:hypothetical protein NTG1052_350008 [Candidatus Nitrotoga sp. 1052]